MDIVKGIYTIIGLGYILFSAAEVIATHFLSPIFFRVGIKIKATQSISVDIQQFQIGKVYKTSHAKLKRISKNSCLFRYRRKFLEYGTPFAINGEIQQNNDGLFLIWRIPLAPVIFILIWILLYMANIATILFNIFQENPGQAFQVLFLQQTAITFVGIIWWLFIFTSSLKTEEPRIQLAFSELMFSSLHQKDNS